MWKLEPGGANKNLSAIDPSASIEPTPLLTSYRYHV